MTIVVPPPRLTVGGVKNSYIMNIYLSTATRLKMDPYDCYVKAGRIASEVRENVRKMDLVGRDLYEICERIEKEIIARGGAPAFPVNVSLNEIAAHYTAEPNDRTVVNTSDIVKVDIGVHVEGFIADTAVTVTLNSNHQDMINVAEIALNEAIKISKPNAKSADIGGVIEKTISKNGFKAIQNLSGHSLEHYTIHAGKSIPNVRTFSSSFGLTVNEAYAIEPFVTTKDGQGIVYEGKVRNIFSIISRKPTKDSKSNEFLQNIWQQYRTLPFTTRWFMHDYDEITARKMLEILLNRKNLRAYPILVEGHYKAVAQAEHTIILSKNETEIITR
jgi:methionyl aminopeptidase